MRRSSIFPLLKVLAIPVIALALVVSARAAPKYKVLHSFGSAQDGEAPYAPVAMDSSGSLYGTTAGGGAYDGGTVFKLMPGSSAWTESVLYSFGGTNDDGAGPYAGLSFDSLGNLYGTTLVGGGADSVGTVFELTPGSNGWTESVLHSFGKPDGGRPYSGVVLDAKGNLYGVTSGGGDLLGGAAYELSPGSDGWTETLLHTFGGTNDGYFSLGGLAWDGTNKLYGTTSKGGAYDEGTVFQLARSSGAWKERVLYSFGSAKRDGGFPGTGSLILDGAGNLYGTTEDGGTNICFSEYDCGTVYELSPGSDGHWKEKILYDFKEGASGFTPLGLVARDKAGNIYGTTSEGGDSVCACGVVYKLAPQPDDKWKYTVLHKFVAATGGLPEGGVILDEKGNLYGTTLGGGAHGDGVVFELTP
jgi:uncharacterized repeat protein (TIGR03803 family)